MPGMETGAPLRTETSSGLRRPPKHESALAFDMADALGECIAQFAGTRRSTPGSGGKSGRQHKGLRHGQTGRRHRGEVAGLESQVSRRCRVGDGPCPREEQGRGVDRGCQFSLL